jgi:hypothetical protein
MRCTWLASSYVVTLLLTSTHFLASQWRETWLLTKVKTFMWKVSDVEWNNWWHLSVCSAYEGVSKSFRTSRLEWELQMVQLSATRRSCIAILWVSLMSFAAVTLCVASQRVFIVAVYFVMDSIRKLLDTPSYNVPLISLLQSFTLCNFT